MQDLLCLEKKKEHTWQCFQSRFHFLYPLWLHSIPSFLLSVLFLSNKSQDEHNSGIFKAFLLWINSWPLADSTGKWNAFEISKQIRAYSLLTYGSEHIKFVQKIRMIVKIHVPILWGMPKPANRPKIIFAVSQKDHAPLSMPRIGRPVL